MIAANLPFCRDPFPWPSSFQCLSHRSFTSSKTLKMIPLELKLQCFNIFAFPLPSWGYTQLRKLRSSPFLSVFRIIEDTCFMYITWLLNTLITFSSNREPHLGVMKTNPQEHVIHCKLWMDATIRSWCWCKSTKSVDWSSCEMFKGWSEVAEPKPSLAWFCLA